MPEFDEATLELMKTTYKVCFWIKDGKITEAKRLPLNAESFAREGEPVMIVTVEDGVMEQADIYFDKSSRRLAGVSRQKGGDFWSIVLGCGLPGERDGVLEL